MKSLVILVDDDPVINFINRKMMQKSGISNDPEVFQNGQEALIFIKTHHSDYSSIIILLDINMPGMSGWEFLETLTTYSEEITKKILVYMLSSSIAQEDIDRANENNLVKSYITKPLSAKKCQDILVSGAINQC